METAYRPTFLLAISGATFLGTTTACDASSIHTSRRLFLRISRHETNPWNLPRSCQNHLVHPPPLRARSPTRQVQPSMRKRLLTVSEAIHRTIFCSYLSALVCSRTSHPYWSSGWQVCPIKAGLWLLWACLGLSLLLLSISDNEDSSDQWLTFLFLLFLLLVCLFLTGLCGLLDFKLDDSDHWALVPIFHVCTFQTAKSHRGRDTRIILERVVGYRLKRVRVSKGRRHWSVGNTESVWVNLWRHCRGECGWRRLKGLSNSFSSMKVTRMIPAGRRTRRRRTPSSPGSPYPWSRWFVSFLLRPPFQFPRRSSWPGQ